MISDAVYEQLLAERDAALELLDEERAETLRWHNAHNEQLRAIVRAIDRDVEGIQDIQQGLERLRSRADTSAVITAELAEALKRIYDHEMAQSHPYALWVMETARAALIAVGLCPHLWQPKEARARLDSRSYVLRSTLFTWECEYCKETRSSATIPENGWALPGWPAGKVDDVIDVEAK